MDQNQNHPPKEIRSPVNLRIKFRSETLPQFIERYAIDVSRGGIFIRTREPLAVGTQLKLDFQYQNGAPLMAGEGTVVWIRELDPKRPNVPPGMGVRFDRLSAESQLVLDQLLEDKAKHDRGMSPGGTERAGGIAVRRPSSMFAALEPEQVSAMPSPPSIGGGAAPGPGAATFPGRPSAAYIPTLSALAAQSQSPVKSATIVPSAAPAPAQPQAGNVVRAPTAPTSPPLASPARAPLSAAPVRQQISANVSTDTTVVARIPTSSATESPASSAGGPYRPLGTTRNPFSSASPVAPSAAGGRPLPADASGMMTGPLLTDADLGQDDDLNEEPTQIAGRMPSFLVSDEDPTSIGPRPGAVPETWFGRSTSPGDARPVTPKNADASSSRSSDSALRALGGGREPSLPSAEVRKTGQTESTAAVGRDASRARQSLDLAPPLESGQAGISAEARSLRSTGEPLGTASGSAALLAGHAAPLDRAASLDGPVGLTGEANLGAGRGAISHAPAGSATARPAARRPQPLLVGLTVLALGAAAFFVFKYFASQATETPTSADPAPAIAIAPAEPAPAVPSPATPPAARPTAAGDEATRTAPPVPTETAPQGAALPTPAAQTDEPGSAPSAKAEPGGPPTGTTAVAAHKAEKNDDVSPAAPTSKATGGAEIAPPVAAAPRKTIKHKAARAVSAHDDAESAPVVGATSDKPASAATKPATLADAPAPPSDVAVAAGAVAPEGDAAAASGHQIRVTSKPPGADVAIDGQVVGQTPLATSIADVSAPHFLSVRKDGFEPFEQMISSTSAWAKGKGTKGQAAVPTLKINAKLKSVGGGGGEAKTTPADGDAPPTKELAAPAKGAEDRIDRPLAPSAGDERAPVAP